MTVRPKVPADLALAPVAVSIDLNLQRLRDLTQPQIVDDLVLQLKEGIRLAPPTFVRSDH
jgi:hypothetical protein